MKPNQRLSILTFPQFFDGSELKLNIVVLPRDHNPLAPIIVDDPLDPPAPQVGDSNIAFADAEFLFKAQLVQGLGANPLPMPKALADGIALTVTPSDNPREIFEAMAKHLEIDDESMINSNHNLGKIPDERQFEKAMPVDKTVKKYLPKTYRSAFNFTVPRTKNAVTDDSYHCAVKAAKFYPKFEQSSKTVSWGKVFAHILRQPLLAKRAGFIYSATLPVDENTFPEGGYLYIDMAEGSSYSDQFADDDTFIKRYAARIPKLVPGEPRQVFAPLLFPVRTVHDGTYDQLFIEAAEYDDGFAKVVHCQQPPHRDRLIEEADGSYPTKDTGIQLGWDDEQILIWYMRQLMIDPSVGGVDRLDAPIGVFGYVIDVRETEDAEDLNNPWESLNAVRSKQILTLLKDPDVPNDSIELGEFKGELPYQVYPMQLDGDRKQNYWLPMYFAGWNGHSMVLPDEDAAKVYQTTHAQVKGDPDNVLLFDKDGNPVKDKDGNQMTTGTGVTGGAKNQLNQMYEGGEVRAQLRYGSSYQFRIRLQDISGGTPSIDKSPINKTASDIANCQFKRFIAPIQPRIQEIEVLKTNDENEKHPILSTDTPSQLNELNIKRPKLGYPAVVYTDKYSDPIQRLLNQSNLSLDRDQNDHSKNAEHAVGLGIADPDVDRVEITVEIESLKLDKLDSVNGKEDYVHLYTTKRFFPAIDGNEDNYEANLNIPITYIDVQGPDKVLNTGGEINLVQDLGLTDEIGDLPELVLPTARTVRLTIRAVCPDLEDEDGNADESKTKAYYGVVNEADKKLDVRYGEPFSVLLYKPSEDERNLLVQTPGVPKLQGIYMQPDIQAVFDGNPATLLFGKQNITENNNVQQLADQLDLVATGLTLNAEKGKRVVFGCSSRIRHTLAPDGSSITFASKSDLINHWLCCISLEIERDWMWDALETDSFLIKRNKQFTHDGAAEAADVGSVKIIRTASFEALDGPQRNATRIVFIDAVEPKKDPDVVNPDFPDTIDVSYTLETRFKAGHATDTDAPEELALTLPMTTTPVQIPKIASAGIALSPYVRDEKYASSESRKRFLWIEFKEPVLDPQDTYFVRVLANAPDQLISNNHPSLFVAPDDDIPLPIDPEKMRVISPASSNDLAGLNAMQPMVKSTTSDLHYILPLPPGLHANSDEMFGFFTYEFRVGHYERQPENVDDKPEKVWTTAQGRFGRRLKSHGIQHPVPELICMPSRDEKKLWVTAPYAVAVHKGKNVTADPPRTQLWALLYAQVKQADNRDYRNILLDDRPLDWRVRVETDPEVNVFEKYTDEQLELLNSILVKTFKGQTAIAQKGNLLKLKYTDRTNKSSTKYGTTVWSNKQVSQLLAICGLPQDSSLSVVVVETLSQISDIFDHISDLEKPSVALTTYNMMDEKQKKTFAKAYQEKFGSGRRQVSRAAVRNPSPVSEELGQHRIMRTSPLTQVPEICCADC